MNRRSFSAVCSTARSENDPPFTKPLESTGTVGRCARSGQHASERSSRHRPVRCRTRKHRSAKICCSRACSADSRRPAAVRTGSTCRKPSTPIPPPRRTAETAPWFAADSLPARFCCPGMFPAAPGIFRDRDVENSDPAARIPSGAANSFLMTAAGFRLQRNSLRETS